MKKGIRRDASAIIDINLLPRSRRPLEVSPAAAAAVALLCLAVIGVAPVSLRGGEMRDRAAVAEQRADRAETEVRSLQVDLARVRALRIAIDEQRAQIEAIEARLAALRGGARPLGTDLAAIWQLSAQPITVARIASTATGLSITGGAPGPLDAIAYARALGDDGGFTSARMVSFSPAAAGGGQFVVEVTR
jgi:hypothetical protein